jgi:hypothetical protein
VFVESFEGGEGFVVVFHEGRVQGVVVVCVVLVVVEVGEEEGASEEDKEEVETHEVLGCFEVDGFVAVCLDFEVIQIRFLVVVRFDW